MTVTGEVPTVRQRWRNLVGRLWATEERYERGHDQPLGGYAGVLAGYAATIATFVASMRATGTRVPERIDTRDLVLAAAATHKIARLVTKHPVTSPLRAPFTELAGTEAAAELHEEVRGHGAQRAVGELLTCPFCLGHWVAAGFTCGFVVAPKATRLVASGYATLAGADALQYGYAALQQRTES